jgi:hypothetical protein
MWALLGEESIPWVYCELMRVTFKQSFESGSVAKVRCLVIAFTTFPLLLSRLTTFSKCVPFFQSTSVRPEACKTYCMYCYDGWTDVGNQKILCGQKWSHRAALTQVSDSGRFIASFWMNSNVCHERLTFVWRQVWLLVFLNAVVHIMEEFKWLIRGKCSWVEFWCSFMLVLFILFIWRVMALRDSVWMCGCVCVWERERGWEDERSR